MYFNFVSTYFLKIVIYLPNMFSEKKHLVISDIKILKINSYGNYRNFTSHYFHLSLINHQYNQFSFIEIVISPILFNDAIAFIIIYFTILF